MQKIMISKIFLFILIITFICVTALQAQDYSGTYEYSKKDCNGSNIGGGVVIKEIKRRKVSVVSFRVYVSIYNEDCVGCWCNGELEGEAKWTAPNLAEYEEKLEDRLKDVDPTLKLDPSEIKLCQLQFFFSEDSVTVRENNCEYHGAACTFEGTYKKVISKKKRIR